MTKTVLNLLWNKISKNFSTKKLVIDALANKQDLIIDIATIRSNSLSAYLKPSTGIPAGDLASGVVPTNISSFTNDSKYVTEDDMQVVEGANGHEYVEIAGIKWATMNIGASQPSDYGLYFAWGDTQGYTAEQVGSDEGQKYFTWADYKYGNGTSSPGATGMTKYNATDGLTTLEAVDDAAVANWGGSWRMPTTAEFQALGAATTSTWTDDYQGSGVSGFVLTDKTDSSKTLFFPAAGRCYIGSVKDVDSGGYYWSSSLNTNYRQNACYSYFVSSNVYWLGDYNRYFGFAVRPILNASKAPKYATKAELANVATSGSYNDLSNKPTIPTVPTNVSTFTNDAHYVTQDTLDDILGVDVNGLTQIKEVLSDDDTTTGIINLIGQKADAADIQIITNQEIALLFDPYRGHAYVEIAGIKWATMNIGAESITDGGLYFAWGDTQGYTAAQVGTDKNFTWTDYELGNGGDTAEDMIKYNSTDGKTVLEASDDAAVANWGGAWRMPTTAEFQALSAAVNTAWTADYQGSGVAGLVCTDKTDSSKVLFFPACGDAGGGSVNGVGSSGNYWSSSLSSGLMYDARRLNFTSFKAYWNDLVNRFRGLAVRGVAD